MKFIKVFSILLLSLSILIGFSAGTQARIMMMANVSTFTFETMPTGYLLRIFGILQLQVIGN